MTEEISDADNALARLVCKIIRDNEPTGISIATAREVVAALKVQKPTVAYYVPGEAGFYVAPKFMGREYIPEKHKQTAVRLVEADE